MLTTAMYTAVYIIALEIGAFTCCVICIVIFYLKFKPPCGSSHNFLTYGGIPATAPQVTSRHLDAVGSTGGTLETSMHHNATEKSTGFLYGKYDTAVGQPLPRKMKEKDRLPSWMMDKT